MTLTFSGMPALRKKFDTMIKDTEKKLIDIRKEVARELTDLILANTPVWSGRTARSLTWSNDAKLAQMEVHPDRGDTSTDGIFHYHQEFGRTSQMPLGQEPQRRSAEAQAYASLDSADYGLDKHLFVTMNSTASAKVEAGTAPTPDKARNTAIVSVLAIQQVKAKFGNIFK